MADKIKIRRGLLQDIPILDEGELGYVKDRGTVYVGTNTDNNILLNPVLVVEDGYTLDGYLYPAVDNIHGLGTPDNRWANLSLGPGSLHIIAKSTDPGYSVNSDFKIGINPNNGMLEFTSGGNSLFDIDPDTGPIITGLVSETTFDENKSAQSQINQSILQSLDGYLTSATGATVTNTAATGDGYIAFFTSTGTNIAGDNDLYYDRTNGRLGIGTVSPTTVLEVVGGIVGTGGTTGTGVAGQGAASGGFGIVGIGTGNNAGGLFQGAGTGRGLQATGGTGGGNCHGISASGGSTGGAGVVATGIAGSPGIIGFGSSGGAGVVGDGSTTGNGVIGTGGSTSGVGVSGVGGATSGHGVQGTGTGNSYGVVGFGAGSGYGVYGSGGSSSGTGVIGIGGNTNGIGVIGTGQGTGAGISVTGGATGYGAVIQATTTSPARAALRLVPQDTDPSSPNKGDVYFNGATNTLKIYNGTTWQTVTAI